MESDPGFIAALEQAQKSASEGGIPIGAALVDADGQIIGRGHNMRAQKGSAILHAEMACIENTGRLPAKAYHGSTMYTTLSPCEMCAGACLLYKIKRVIIGENNTFVGGEDALRARDVEVINVNSKACEELMRAFIVANPELWNEDIGV